MGTTSLELVTTPGLLLAHQKVPGIKSGSGS